MASRRTPESRTPASTPPASSGSARAPQKSRAAEPPVLAPARRVTPEARRALIAERAYLRAEKRGFVPGRETEDWLAAEVEIDLLLRASHGGSSQ
jgi:hypothetical protein